MVENFTDKQITIISIKQVLSEVDFNKFTHKELNKIWKALDDTKQVKQIYKNKLNFVTEYINKGKLIE